MLIYRVMHEGSARWAMQREDGDALELLAQRSFEDLVEGYATGLEGIELGCVQSGRPHQARVLLIALRASAPVSRCRFLQNQTHMMNQPSSGCASLVALTPSAEKQA